MNDFKRGVEEAVRDELMDAASYSRLALLAPNAQLRAIVQSIAGDESGHARTFSVIANLDPPGLAAPEVQRGESFEQGVRAALDGELKAVSEYVGLARTAPNPEIRNLIMSIVADEFGHARTFASILALLPGRGLG